VKSNEEKEKDRLRPKTTIACVKWLTFQSCALRGHDERPESRNRGNFLEMQKLLAEFCPDIAAVIDGNAPQVCKYNSHEIQNEILGVYAMKVREHKEKLGTPSILFFSMKHVTSPKGSKWH
jgi:hypothetical protein